ncbi:MAG: UDP-glucose 4-epimerase [Elusimicrobia bacterium]|nr:UDP-glucose 4-epimerase [Elusimicrobiota bacterium]
MKALVTGAAGFIGSNLIERLLKEGHSVIGVDNFSTGHAKFLEKFRKHPQFSFFEKNLLNPQSLEGLVSDKIDWLFHLAANADVKDGLRYPERDLQQNTLVTWNVLEASRKAGVRGFVFSSTGSVYGAAPVIPTPEDCPFPIQTSLYGASKLACEGLIAAYAEGYGIQAKIFRFVSILGQNYTHGHVVDFVRQLKSDPTKIHVLGNGQQKKSYLYVEDCVDALLWALNRQSGQKIEIFNLGTEEYVTVDQSLDVIVDELKVHPRRTYEGGDQGWVGDNPFIFLDTTKIRSLGWKSKITIREGVRRTVQFLLNNPWVYEGGHKGR